MSRLDTVRNIAPLQEIRRAFARFGKPSQYICDDLYEPARLDYEEMLGGKPREEIEATDFGLISWSPLLYLTSEAAAYFLPRLIELSESGAKDRDGDPFMMRFIHYIAIGPSAEQFSLLDAEQKGLVTAYLESIASNHMSLVTQECWEETLAEALQAWRGA